MGSANSIGRTALSQTERMITSANALRNIGHNGINCNSRGCPTLVDTMQKFSGNQTIPVYTVDSSNYVGCMSRCHTDRERVMVSHKLSGNSLRGIVHSGMSHSSRGCSSLVDTMRKFNGNSLVILPQCPTLPGAVRRFTGNNLAFYSTSQNKKHFPMPQKPLGINVPQLPVLPYHILHPKTKGPTPLLPLPRLRTYDWMPEFHEPVVDFDQFLKCFPGPMNPGSSIGIPDHYMVFDPVQYVKFNRFFQKTEVQGTHPTWRPWVMTDFAKRLERSLILLLVIYHKLDLCFSNLTLDDLYICCDGTFKVKKSASFEKLTSDGVDKDYSNAADILWLLMQRSMGPLRVLPDDQKNLFRLMKINASEHEYLIATNTAMLPMATRAVALRRFHGEILRVLPAGPLRNDILSKVDVTGWLKRTEGNLYLMNCIAYRKKFKAYKETPEDFLELNRNFDGHQYDNENHLAESDSDVIQYAYFSMLLPEVQEGLWKHGRLAHLFVEELFTDGMSPLLDSLPRSPLCP